jgi:hypothetical protein
LKALDTARETVFWATTRAGATQPIQSQFIIKQLSMCLFALEKQPQGKKPEMTRIGVTIL